MKVTPKLSEIPDPVLAGRVLELITQTEPPIRNYIEMNELRRCAGELARRVEIE